MWGSLLTSGQFESGRQEFHLYRPPRESHMNIKNQYIILNYLYIFLFFSANIHVMNNYHHKPPHQHLIIHMIVTIKFIK